MSFQQSPQLFFQSFLSNDNTIRKQADSFIEQYCVQSPQQAIEFFLLGLTDSQSEYAELSALLLKKKFIDNVETLKQVPKEWLVKILEKTQNLIQQEDKKLMYLKRLAEIIVQIYGFLENYQDLLNFVSQLEKVYHSSNMKKLLMYFIEIICDYAFEEELLVQFSPLLTVLFEKSLLDPEIQVKVAAMKSVSIFLSYITDEKFVTKFTTIFPILLTTSVEAIKIDEEAGKIALESLNDLIEAHPKFIKPIINDLLVLASEIISTKQLNDVLRNTALNMILSLSTESKSLLRKSDVFKKRVLVIFMQVIMEIEDNDENWDKDFQENNISSNTVSATAQDVLAKIVPELGIKFLLPIFTPMIKETLNSEDWKANYAGLMVLGYLAEGMEESFPDELDNIVNILLNCMNKTNNRVEYALLTAIALLCSEFTPSIQNKYHSKIMPYIISKMSSSCSKIQLRAVSSIVNFGRDLMSYPEETKIFLIYSQDLLSNLYKIFQKSVTENNYQMQEELLSALSIISVSIGSEFSTYYSIFMPVLKSLLMNMPAQTPQQISIRALAIECIGFLASSIKDKKEIFIEDLNSIMNFLINLHNNGLNDDDPHIQAIFSVYTQFASCLKSDFAQYLNLVFDKIIKAADIHVDMSLQDNDTREINEKTDRKMVQATIDLKLYGGKKVFSLNTDALELKISAVKSLEAFSKSIGKQYKPFVEKTMEISQKLIEYKYSKEIRLSCIKIAKNLLFSTDNEDDMSKIYNYLLPKILNEVQNLVKLENDEELKIVLKTINKSIKLFKSPLLSQNNISELISLLGSVLKFSEKLKKRLLKEYEDIEEDCDEAQKEDFQTDYEKVNDLVQITMEIQGNIIKIYKTSIENNIVKSLMQHYYTLFTNNESTDNELLYAVCAFDDLLEHCSQELFEKNIKDIMKVFDNLIEKTQNIDIIQSIIYGFGVFSLKISKQDFINYSQSIIKRIYDVINHPEAFSEKRVVCTECAIGALGRISLTHGGEQLMKDFIKLLPLKNESEEAMNVHRFLLSEIIKKNEFINTNLDLNFIKTKLFEIKTLDDSKPEIEILCDKGREIMGNILNSI